MQDQLGQHTEANETVSIHWSGVSLPTIAPDVLQNSELWCQSLQFEFGKTYALQANSGRGKSSAVALLTGSRKDYIGSISLGSIKFEDATPAAWAQWYSSLISIVWQDLRLIQHLTGVENVMVARAKHQQTGNGAQMAKRLGVDSVWHKPVSQLSYGERQRIAIIRALVKPFKFLILDEPFSHLDAHNRKLAADLIQELCQHNEAGYLLTTLAAEPELAVDQLIKL